MKPITELTLTDVEDLRQKKSCVSSGATILYAFTLSDIINAQQHLQTLYQNRVNRTFAERILLLNALY